MNDDTAEALRAWVTQTTTNIQTLADIVADLSERVRQLERTSEQRRTLT